MKTLNLKMSDVEYNRLGITTGWITLAELYNKVRRELMRENLNSCVALAAKYGLSSMTMDEITEEVKAVRHYAKSHS